MVPRFRSRYGTVRASGSGMRVPVLAAWQETNAQY